MTKKEHEFQNRRIINNIQAMFRVHEQLRQYAAALQVSIENATIVLRGEVPSVDSEGRAGPRRPTSRRAEPGLQPRPSRELAHLPAA